MKVKLLRDCSVVALKGSIVEVSEAQAKALGDFCVPVLEGKSVSQGETVKPATKSKGKKEV